MGVTRRTLLATAGLSAGSVYLGGMGRALAQGSGSIQVLLHRSHQAAMEEGSSGSVPGPWAAERGVAIEYLTFDTGPLNERLLREASLGSTDIDVAFFLDSWANPNAFTLLEPLDGYLSSDPIEDFADFFPAR
jgi:multiple sugar transport system substrate-binding protein